MLLQDLSQYGIEEPLAPWERGLEGWLVMGMWYHPVASLLAAWAPPQNWPDVSGAPDTVGKALQVVGETL